MLVEPFLIRYRARSISLRLLRVMALPPVRSPQGAEHCARASSQDKRILWYAIFDMLYDDTYWFHKAVNSHRTL